jgi:hypothetical protein
LIRVVRCGTGAFGGLFFNLINNTSGSFFEVCKTNPAMAASVVDQLKDAWQIWTGNRPESRISVKALRELVLNDASLERIIGEHSIDHVRSFELRSLDVHLGTQHRDFHGENILVGENGAPIMIDLLSIGEASAAFDPITLELSLVFHPNSPFNGTWPPIDQIPSWADLDAYLKHCPYADIVRSCRAWATVYAVTDRELFAAVYAYVVWQMNFSSTDTERAKAYLEMAISHFDVE